ncbi:hypothetical protein CBR_g71972 [Chara braunii]|uniref:Cyanate hydratase n=1 Tax=Chara braunii TaxID=69332 RepID=A0A388MG88_CHABU|nr:hypothetical protein CBR_g71972 [Chara braunii]|eukprot:GBG93495.1 hypothetical protein CBR_g71972 [Chara braunii]
MSGPKNEEKEELVARLMECKAKSGKTFDQIAKECKLTNAYTAQLFFNQAKLHPETEKRLVQAVPSLGSPKNHDILEAMRKPPFRGFDDGVLLQEPMVYRVYEAVMQYGEAIKEIINEQHGDGVMSAIDFVCKVEKKTGKQGEPRVVLTFDGKFLPHVEQTVDE